MAGPNLQQDDAGNVWDMSSGKPVFVHGPQAPAGPQVIVPAPPAKPEFVPGHPNLVMAPNGDVKPLPGVPGPEPKTTYRQLSPQEIASRHLNPQHAYQVSSDGDVKDLGAMSGGDAEDARKQSALEATHNLVQSIEKAKNLVSGYSTGIGATIGKLYPGSDQANQLDTIINQEIRGNIFQNWVSQMKAQTDTGTSGIGRIMQSEIPLVTGALGALDPAKMGKQGTLDSLNQIEGRVVRSAALLNNENPDDPKVAEKYRRQFLPPLSDSEIQSEVKARIARGDDPASIIQYLTSIGRPPSKDTIAAILANRGNQTPDVRPPQGGGYPNSFLGQALSGANEGLADTLGAPADLARAAINLVPQGINALANTNIPTLPSPIGGSDSIKSFLSRVGSIQGPVADPAKQFVRRVGEDVGASAVPGMFGGTLAKMGAALLSGLGGGIGAATAQQVAPGNPLAEFAGDVAGSGLTGLGLAKAAQRAAQRGIESAVPTVEELKRQASDLYRTAEQRGVTASPGQTQQLADQFRKTLVDEGQLGPNGAITNADTNTSKAFNLVQQYAGQPMTPTQMNTVRTVLSDSRQSSDPADRRLGKILLDQFDEFVNPLAPEFGQARAVASRYLQAQDLEKARELAGARASQFTGSGFENALRTEYRALDRNNIKGNNYFSPDVTQAIQTVARGTPASNFARGVGKFAPTGVVPMMGDVLPAMAVSSMASPATGGMFGAGLAGAGIAGRVTATRMGINAADKAELIARNGGALDQAPLLPDDVRKFLAQLAAVQQAKYLSGNSPQ